MGLRGATISSFFLNLREILEIGEIPRGATYPRGATCPAALAWKEEVAKRLPPFHRQWKSESESEKWKWKWVKNFFVSDFAENWLSCCSRQVNIFVFPDFCETKLLWVYEGRLSRGSSWISGKFWKSGNSHEGRLARDGRLALPR